MIDFSQYNEEAPFVIALTNENAFIIESPFDEKRQRYIYELKEYDRSTYRYFDNIEPDWVINVTRKADMAYDFFSDFERYAQRVKILASYEYLYVEKLEEAWNIVKQLFYKIGSPHKLFGYFDHQVNQFISGTIDKPTLINRIELGVNDMRVLLDPVIDFLYLLEIGTNLMNSSWGTLNEHSEIDALLIDYGQTIVSSNIDDRFEAIGTSIQLSTELTRTNLKSDKTNVEMIMSKNLKLSMNAFNLNARLNNLVFVNPNYP